MGEFSQLWLNDPVFKHHAKPVVESDLEAYCKLLKKKNHKCDLEQCCVNRYHQWLH